jgi:hypothetical protein
VDPQGCTSGGCGCAQQKQGIYGHTSRGVAAVVLACARAWLLHNYMLWVLLPCVNACMQIGPLNLRFTIPMYSASRIALKYLQILKRDKNYNPYRWVRYVTSSTSYTFRT